MRISVRRIVAWRNRGVLFKEPWWAQSTLLVIVVASALLSSWNIGYAGYSTFYSTAARSMSESWRAFVFGAFDPGAHITLDKLSGFLIPQALSARILGFHAWSIALPQVIEGAITIVAVYVIATRWRGTAVGLFAAAATATTPLFASMFGHVMEDGLLTMSLALAFLCLQSALLTGRLASLLLSALWVAIGFQAKMMQAWIILPAFAVWYLLGASVPRVQRIRRTVLGGGVAVALSLVWMTAIQLVPASSRPYIDGSTNNNIYSMVFGYNGINRIFPYAIPGSIRNPPSAASPISPPPARGSFTTVAYQVAVAKKTQSPGAEPTKLLLPFYATQVGWLYPLAFAGIVVGLWPFIGLLPFVERRYGRAPPIDATAVALIVWLLMAVALISVAKVPHTAYVAAISVQVALLSALGMTQAIRLFRSHAQAARWVLPILVAIETLWTARILGSSTVADSFLLPTIAVLGTLATVAIVVVTLRPAGAPVVRAALASAVVAMLVVPTIWTGSVLSRGEEGDASDAYAGVRPAQPGESTATPQMRRPFVVHAPFIVPRDPRLSAAQLSLVAYVWAHRPRHGPLMASDLWTTASTYILDEGLNVMPMGGFSGRMATPTLAQLQSMVASDHLRFVLLNENESGLSTAQKNLIRARGGGEFMDGSDTGEYEGEYILELRTWIHAHCTMVPPSAYEMHGRTLNGQVLYSCSASGSA